MEPVGKLARKLVTATTAAALGSVGALGIAASAQADVLDRAQERCGSTLVTAKLERDGREREVDVEVYSSKRGERWRIVVRNSDGDVLKRITRKTNREGEFDVWRYLPPSTDEVSIDVRGPNKQRCTIKLMA